MRSLAEPQNASRTPRSLRQTQVLFVGEVPSPSAQQHQIRRVRLDGGITTPTISKSLSADCKMTIPPQSAPDQHRSAGGGGAGWESVRNVLIFQLRFFPQLGKKPRLINMENRTHAPQQKKPGHSITFRSGHRLLSGMKLKMIRL
jgi:hypothetical protein